MKRIAALIALFVALLCPALADPQTTLPDGTVLKGYAQTKGYAPILALAPLDGAGWVADLAAMRAAQQAQINATLGATLTPPIQTIGQSKTVTEISQTLTATGNSGVIANQGTTIQASITLGAFGGTSPALQLAFQVCSDGGVSSCRTVWSAPNVTSGSRTFEMQPMTMGSPYRWVWTIGGTTPTIPLAIATTRGAGYAPFYVEIGFDGLFSSSGAGSSTNPLPAAGCKQFTSTITLGSGTAPTLQGQMSVDGNSNWINVPGAAWTPTAAATTINTNPMGGAVGGFFRWNNTATGTATMLGFSWRCN